MKPFKVYIHHTKVKLENNPKNSFVVLIKFISLQHRKGENIALQIKNNLNLER